jgi:hypothetical protein
VGELDRHLDAIGVLSGAVRLLDGSYSFVSLNSEEPMWNRTTSGVFNDTALFKSTSTIEQTLMILLLDHDLLVGSVHVGNHPKCRDDGQQPDGNAVRFRSKNAATD